MPWFVYIAKCNDGTLYTGITTDLKRREFEHNNDNKLGAKSLRHKRPVHIVYSQIHKSQSAARTEEIKIKSWKRIYKLRLVRSQKNK